MHHAHPLPKFHTRFNIWKGIFTFEVFQSHKITNNNFTCEINFDIWAINVTCGKVCETQISYVKVVNCTYEMGIYAWESLNSTKKSSFYIICKFSKRDQHSGVVIFSLTCNEVKIAKRYFQTRASWLTAITLNPQDNPSVANKIITPRAAELDNICIMKYTWISKIIRLNYRYHWNFFLQILTMDIISGSSLDIYSREIQFWFSNCREIQLQFS